MVTVLFMGLTTAWEVKITFDSCRTKSTNFAFEDKSYLLIWDGNRLTSSCKFTFYGFDNVNENNKYKICIQTIEWTVNDDAVILKYYSDTSNDFYKPLRQTYTRWDSPMTEWCSAPSEYVNVHLNASSLVANQGNIILKIYAVMTFNYREYVGTVVGGVLGGLSIVIIIITVIIIIVCRRKRQHGTILSTSSFSGTSVTNTSSEDLVYTTDNDAPEQPPSYYTATHNECPAYSLPSFTEPPPYSCSTNDTQSAGNK